MVMKHDQNCRQHAMAAVTGGTGFIGRRLVMQLVKMGHKVRVLSRNIKQAESMLPSVEVFEGNLADPQFQAELFLEKVDVLYNCAGELKDEAMMSIVHVGATEKLVNAAKNRIKHWVQLSSAGVYGSLQEGDVDEAWPSKPVGMYEKTKAASDDIVIKAAGISNGFSAVILRPANVYGPEMPGMALDSMINAIRKRCFFFIGSPGATVHFIHVDDVVKALILCGEARFEKNEIFNLSDTRTIEEFAGIITDIIGLKPVRMRLPEAFIRTCSLCLSWMPGFPLNTKNINTLVSRVNYLREKIENQLSFKIGTSLEQGLADYIAFKRFKSG